jgi:aminopeptidase N
MYADPSWAQTGRSRLAAASAEALETAEPGSDLQLAWARSLGSLAHTDEQVALVRGLLDGSRTVPGLSVDTELRWHLLTRLVVLGLVGEESIAQELASDNTAAGQRRAAAARAAMPTAQAKEQAWRLAVEDDSLPNAVQAAVISGFWQVEQLELLAPYAARYFSVVNDVWSTRQGEMGQNVAVGLYPALLVTPEVVGQTDAHLSTSGDAVPPALERILLEGRDGVVRSLRARERDAAS